MPAKKYEYTKKEILAGLMVLASAAILIAFVAVIRGYRPQIQVNTYYAKFTNTIGLDKGADVRFGGLKVGRVTAITPDPEDQSQVRVEAGIRPDIPVNEKSIATVEQVSFTAPRHLEISTGEKDAAKLGSGGTVASLTKSGGIVEIPDVSVALKKVEGLLDDVRAFLGVEEAQALEAKGEEKFARLSKITAQVSATLDEGTGLVKDVRGVLDEQRPNINDIVKNLRGIEDSAKKLVDQLNGMLAENRDSLKRILTDVNGITADVGGMVDKVSGELETLMKTLEDTLGNAEGLSANARSFLENNRGALEDMILDLRDTVRYLRAFTRTLSEQPQSIITGKPPEGRK
jgi:phospholipid/cholesterol/gamma-HCH transport system substrate-binding protein